MKKARLALAVGALSASFAAAAHHGFGNFDRSREVSWSGSITKIDFVNPHAYVYFEVAGVAHRCEMRAATVLRRSGWSAEMFKAGEPIEITGAPDRFDANSCYVNTVVFADGTTADRYAQLTRPGSAATAVAVADRPARLPSGEPNIAGDWAPEQLVMTDPRGRQGALVPVSRAQEFEPGAAPAPGGAPGRPRVTFTPEGQKAADAFRGATADNPRMRCETTSILFDWTFDGPVNRITQSSDTITLQYGQLGFTRTIHMNTEHPATIQPSRAGHSTGRWENDVLVVDTVGFAPGVLNPPIMNSDQLHVVERFSFDPATTTIKREYTATDPVNYTDQFTGGDTVAVADLPYAPDACQELTFVDFSGDGVAPDANSGGIPPTAAGAPAQPTAAPSEAAKPAAWWEFWKWFD